MPPRRKVAEDLTVYEVRVSGTSYNYGLKDYPIQPVKSVKKGFGVIHTYELTKRQRSEMFAHLAEVALTIADAEGDSSYNMLQVYKDMDRIGV